MKSWLRSQSLSASRVQVEEADGAPLSAAVVLQRAVLREAAVACRCVWSCDGRLSASASVSAVGSSTVEINPSAPAHLFSFRLALRRWL